MRLTGPVRLGGDWDNLVVICAANSWDAVKMMDQHLAERMAKLGPVLYVDPPLSRLSPLLRPELAASLQGPRLRLVGSSLARLTPIVLPGRFRPGMTWLTTRTLRLALRAAATALGGSVRAVIAATVLLNPFGASGERVKVFWAQDDFATGARAFGLSATRIRRGEARLAAAADVIVAANPLVADAWRGRGFHTIMIPFGCDSELFAGADRAPLPTDVRLVPPIAGFIGHLGDRIDIRLLEAVADRGHSLLLVGPHHPTSSRRRMQALLARSNVQWVGPKRFEDLPSYQRVIDVGLVPYTASPFNQASFPLKTLEYLAAGRPVVATDLPAIRWLNTELVSIASDPTAFASAVDHQLREPRTAAWIARRRAFAARHDWTVQAQEFARVVGVLPGPPGVVTCRMPWS